MPVNRRIHVTVEHHLDRRDLMNAFCWYARAMEPSQLLSTPPTRKCIQIVEKALWMHGIQAFDDDLSASQAAFDWARRCTDRLWNSRLVARQ